MLSERAEKLFLQPPESPVSHIWKDWRQQGKKKKSFFTRKEKFHEEWKDNKSGFTVAELLRKWGQLQNLPGIWQTAAGKHVDLNGEREIRLEKYYQYKRGSFRALHPKPLQVFVALNPCQHLVA